MKRYLSHKLEEGTLLVYEKLLNFYNEADNDIYTFGIGLGEAISRFMTPDEMLQTATALEDYISEEEE